MKTKWSSIVLFIILIATVLGICYLQYYCQIKDFYLEVLKGLIQLAVVVIIGGFVSLIIKQHEDSKRKGAEITGTRRTILNRLNHVFISTKKVRRRMRGLSSQSMNSNQKKECAFQKADFDKQIQHLNDTQLEIEAIGLELLSYKKLFKSEEFDIVKDYLTSMDEYIRRIIRDYEQCNKAKEVTISDSSSPSVYDFLIDGDGYEDSHFKFEFIHAFYNCYDVLIEKLIDGKLGIEKSQ